MCSRINKFFILLILLGIPVVLNYVLQATVSSTLIIGGNESPQIWLSFWGSYLAAIGSAFVAIVAVCNERKNRKRDYLNHKLSEMRGDYFVVEKEIKELLEIHSLSQLTGINRAYEKGDLAVARDIQASLFSKLQYSLIPVERYHDKHYSPDFLKALKNVNAFFLDKVLEITELIENSCDGPVIASSQEWIKRVSDEWGIVGNQNDLFNSGMDLLHNLREKINRTERELQSVACGNEKAK